MKINKKYIVNINSYIDNDSNSIVITSDVSDTTLFQRAGFNVDNIIGDSILPNIIGIHSNRNVNGFYIVDDTDTELRSWDVYWGHYEWHGPDKTWVEDFYTKSKLCKKRLYVNATNLYIKINSINEVTYRIQIVLPNNVSYDIIKHAINIMLELFGECDINNNDDEVSNVNYCNWHFFPKGSHLGDQETTEIEFVKSTKQNKKFIEFRINELKNILKKSNSNYDIYKGIGGFSTYIAYVTDEVAILESNSLDNATYIFDANTWKDNTKLSKSVLFNNKLYNDRVIHNKYWLDNIKKCVK